MRILISHKDRAWLIRQASGMNAQKPQYAISLVDSKRLCLSVSPKQKQNNKT